MFNYGQLLLVWNSQDGYKIAHKEYRVKLAFNMKIFSLYYKIVFVLRGNGSHLVSKQISPK